MNVFANSVAVSKTSQNWGLGPLEEKKKPGTVPRSHRQRMDGNAFVSQQQELKSQRGVKPTVKLTAMEVV